MKKKLTKRQKRMKIILRTKCGCTRSISGDCFPVPMPRDFYVPLQEDLSFILVDGENPKDVPVAGQTRRFTYWKKDFNGDIIFKERD